MGQKSGILVTKALKRRHTVNCCHIGPRIFDIIFNRQAIQKKKNRAKYNEVVEKFSAYFSTLRVNLRRPREPRPLFGLFSLTTSSSEFSNYVFAVNNHLKVFAKFQKRTRWNFRASWSGISVRKRSLQSRPQPTQWINCESKNRYNFRGPWGEEELVLRFEIAEWSCFRKHFRTYQLLIRPKSTFWYLTSQTIWPGNFGFTKIIFYIGPFPQIVKLEQ